MGCKKSEGGKVQSVSNKHVKVQYAKVEPQYSIVEDRGMPYLDEATSSALNVLSTYEGFLKSPTAKLLAIKKGLEPHAITDLINITGSTQSDIAHILVLTEPTLRKFINASKELNTGLSEHILQLFELFEKGIDTFGSLKEFKNWLPQHNIGIDAKPIELLDTLTGISIIMNLLQRIDYGVLA